MNETYRQCSKKSCTNKPTWLIDKESRIKGRKSRHVYCDKCTRGEMNRENDPYTIEIYTPLWVVEVLYEHSE